MGIEPGEHAFDGVPQQLRVLHLLDIVRLELAKNLREDPQVLERQRLQVLLALGENGPLEADTDTDDDPHAEDRGVAEMSHHSFNSGDPAPGRSP